MLAFNWSQKRWNRNLDGGDFRLSFDAPANQVQPSFWRRHLYKKFGHPISPVSATGLRLCFCVFLSQSSQNNETGSQHDNYGILTAFYPVCKWRPFENTLWKNRGFPQKKTTKPKISHNFFQKFIIIQFIQNKPENSLRSAFLMGLCCSSFISLFLLSCINRRQRLLQHSLLMSTALR